MAATSAPRRVSAVENHERWVMTRNVRHAHVASARETISGRSGVDENAPRRTTRRGVVALGPSVKTEHIGYVARSRSRECAAEREVVRSHAIEIALVHGRARPRNSPELGSVSPSTERTRMMMPAYPSDIGSRRSAKRCGRVDVRDHRDLASRVVASLARGADFDDRHTKATSRTTYRRGHNQWLGRTPASTRIAHDRDLSPIPQISQGRASDALVERSRAPRERTHAQTEFRQQKLMGGKWSPCRRARAWMTGNVCADRPNRHER